MRLVEKLQIACLAAVIVMVMNWAVNRRLQANNVTYPTKNYSFSAGTTIVASQVNSDFDQLFNEIGGNLGAANLLSDAITTPKIVDLAVTTAKINNLAVTTGKISPSAIDSTLLATDAVTTTALQNTSVTNAKLASGAVTAAKVTGDGNSEHYLDGTSTWSVPQGTTPTGSVIAFAGSTAPSRWLLCYGQAVSRTTYSGLFSVISTTYGAGDLSTTFNVPDLRGRAAFGKDDMGGSAANRITAAGCGITGTTLGASGGEQTHTLTTTEMPAHTHTEYTIGVAAYDVASGYPSYPRFGASGTNTGSAGGGGAHNNVPPAIVLNYIIKY